MYHCSNNFKVVDKHHEEKVVMEVVKSVHGSLWGCSFQKVIPLNKRRKLVYHYRLSRKFFIKKKKKIA